MLFEGQFLSAGSVIAHRQVVIAMEAIERAPPSYLDGNLKRRSFPLKLLVNESGQLAISRNLQILPLLNSFLSRLSTLSTLTGSAHYLPLVFCPVKGVREGG